MATFVFTWDTGYVTEITVPNVVGDICDKRYNNTISKHSNAITQLLYA